MLLPKKVCVTVKLCYSFCMAQDIHVIFHLSTVAVHYLSNFSTISRIHTRGEEEWGKNGGKKLGKNVHKGGWGEGRQTGSFFITFLQLRRV